MTALTLGKIIRLLGFTFPLPPPIAESGFPKGAAVSVAALFEQNNLPPVISIPLIKVDCK